MLHRAENCKEMSKTKESEKDLEKALYARVRDAGGHALKFSSMSEIGYPDRLVLMPRGRAYWVELKSEGKKPRKIQELRAAELVKLGFICATIDTTAKLNEFIKTIEHDLLS